MSRMSRPLEDVDAEELDTVAEGDVAGQVWRGEVEGVAVAVVEAVDDDVEEGCLIVGWEAEGGRPEWWGKSR